MATVAELYGAVHRDERQGPPAAAVLVARAPGGALARLGETGFLTGQVIVDDMGACRADPAWLVRFSDGEQDAYFSEELDLICI